LVQYYNVRSNPTHENNSLSNIFGANQYRDHIMSKRSKLHIYCGKEPVLADPGALRYFQGTIVPDHCGKVAQN